MLWQWGKAVVRGYSKEIVGSNFSILFERIPGGCLLDGLPWFQSYMMMMMMMDDGWWWRRHPVSLRVLCSARSKHRHGRTLFFRTRCVLHLCSSLSWPQSRITCWHRNEKRQMTLAEADNDDDDGDGDDGDESVPARSSNTAPVTQHTR